MAENDAPELKPCPFCGAEAAVYYHGGDGALQASDQVDVGCSSMDGCAVGPRIAADPENEQWAIKTWNTRTDLAGPDAAQCQHFAEREDERVKEAEREFLEASIAVWREIDKGGPPLDSSVELRRRERAAWEKYRDALSLLPVQPAQLGMDTDWPLKDVLNTLADAVEHLGRVHDCDCHGWEIPQGVIPIARDYAQQVAIQPAASTPIQAQRRCPDCGGSGTAGYATREMALDAGDEQLEGVRVKCSTCSGDGWIIASGAVSTEAQDERKQHDRNFE